MASPDSSSYPTTSPNSEEKSLPDTQALEAAKQSRPSPSIQTSQQNEFDFIELPPQDYFCPISFDLLLEPQQTKCCGNHLSLEVTTKLQKEGKPCPICKSEEWSADLDKYHGRKVHQVRVRCWYKESGCGWEGDVNGFKKHEGCCVKRPWECEYCGLKCTYGEGEGKHWPECDKFPEPCPNGCEVGSVERCGMEQHRSVCPLEPVACEMKEFGCSVVLPRKELATHMKESELQHLTAMTALNLRLTRQLQQDNARVDQIITQQQKEIEEQKLKIAALQAEVLEEQKKLGAETDLKLETQKSGLTMHIQKVEHTIHHIQQHTSTSGIYVVLEVPEPTIILYSEPFYSYHHGYKFQLGIVIIPNEFRATSLTEFRKWQKGWCNHAIQVCKEYKELEQKFREKELQSKYFEIERNYQLKEQAFVISEKSKFRSYSEPTFEEVLKCFQDRNNQDMQEEKDYLKENYRLQGHYEDLNSLNINKTIDSIGHVNLRDAKFYFSYKLRHSNIFSNLHLMEGEYDDQLQWPVEVRVQLELLNPTADHSHQLLTKNMTLTREKRGKEDDYLFAFSSLEQQAVFNGRIKFRVVITVC